MPTNPLKDGVISVKSVGVGTVTGEMVRKRATELAMIDGNSSTDAIQSHFAEAKRELTGGPDMDPIDTLLESVPESEHWDPVIGSNEEQARVAPSEDEDEEGRSDQERLVEAGMAEAAIEQSFQAARAASHRSS